MWYEMRYHKLGKFHFPRNTYPVWLQPRLKTAGQKSAVLFPEKHHPDEMFLFWLTTQTGSLLPSQSHWLLTHILCCPLKQQIACGMQLGCHRARFKKGYEPWVSPWGMATVLLFSLENPFQSKKKTKTQKKLSTETFWVCPSNLSLWKPNSPGWLSSHSCTHCCVSKTETSSKGCRNRLSLIEANKS